MRTSSFVVCLSLAALSACARDTVTPTPLVDADDPAQTIARAFAVALSDEQLRTEFRDVLRASPFVEHKVALRLFVGGATGQRFVGAAARGVGMTPAEILALIEELPPMHLYMPRREDRRTWRATANVVVAATLDNDTPPEFVWSSRGLRMRADIHGSDAILLLEPLEQNDLRVDPQQSALGLVIQDADDGEFGGALLVYDAGGGLVRETQLAQLMGRDRLTRANGIARVCDNQAIYCDPEPLYGGSWATDTTILHRFYFDGGAHEGWGGTEMEFRATAYNANGSWADSRTLRIESNCPWVHWYSCSTPHAPLMFLRIRDNTQQSMFVSVVETDWLDDDEYGSRSFYDVDNGLSRMLTGGGHTSHMTLSWTPIQ